MEGGLKKLSEYRGMWLFTMFDLPVVSVEDRRRYTQFRNTLLKLGFEMLQFSVYARYCASEDGSELFRKRVQKALPPGGQVRLLSVTDRQFGKMEVYYGKRKQSPQQPPPQMLLF
ncbi:MAG: CRISPR-associated endonuclease Cas2 [Candidatus Hydrogenedentes bacterium]|nr:CRISPR-associated endonuclease Cas2 [Candidatus Hydrogenedentota bacterium]